MTETFGAYTDMKFAHHIELLKRIERAEIVPPVNVQLVPTNKCNLSCNFCYYRNSAFPATEEFGGGVQMPTDKLLEVIRDCTDMGVKAITLCGGGEPTVHPAFMEAVGLIFRGKMQLSLMTNGVLVSDFLLASIANPAFEWLRVSLDAGTDGTFSAIKGCGEGVFDAVIKNIERIVSRKQAVNPKIYIGVGFVVTLENYKDIIYCAEMMRDIGVDSFRVRSVAGTVLDEFYEDKAETISSICKEAEALSTKVYAVENRFVDSVSKIQYPDRCLFQHLHTYIGADMRVYNCCLYAYNERGVKGELAMRSFKDMWNSQDHWRHLRTFCPKNHCKTCDFTYKNELLAYLANPKPLHVNFF